MPPNLTPIQEVMGTPNFMLVGAHQNLYKKIDFKLNSSL